MRFDYPKYQVIFALQNEEDEAIPVVRMIMERYPEVDSRLIIGKSSRCLGDVFSKFVQAATLEAQRYHTI